LSRLASLSPAALKAMFSPDADDTLITLLTITGTGVASPVRIADGYTQRISETADEVIYGVPSRSNDYLFLPFKISLPTEEQAAAPRCTITINDVTRQLLPIIRQLNSAPDVLIELVLSSAPNVVEASFPGFKMGAISYTADSISAELTVESLATEPFPQHTFTPAYFPGLF
jgi:hypothetical protein